MHPFKAIEVRTDIKVSICNGQLDDPSYSVLCEATPSEAKLFRPIQMVYVNINHLVNIC